MAKKPADNKPKPQVDATEPEEVTEDDAADNGSEAGETPEAETPAEGEATEGADNEGHDDEQPEGQADEAPEGTATQPAADDWDKRRQAIYERAERWGQPPAPNAPAATAAPAADAKPAEDKDEPFKLSAEGEAEVARVAEKEGKEFAENTYRPLLERTEKAERRSEKSHQKNAAEIKRLSDERKAEQEAQAAAAQTHAMNAAGRDTAAITGKGYEAVLGKIGAFDPKTGGYSGSTSDQNQVIGRLYQAANFYYSQAQQASDPISQQDALRMGLEHMEARDPAFRGIREAKAAAAKRSKQITHPPARGRASTSANGKAGDQKAVEALRAWRDRNPIDGPEIGV